MGPTRPVPELPAPTAWWDFDPAQPGATYMGACSYTIATTGTNTITTGRPTLGGNFCGYVSRATTTSTTYIFDSVVTGTTTVNYPLTGAIVNPSAGALIPALPNGAGIRYNGTLLCVIQGAVAAANVLWN